MVLLTETSQDDFLSLFVIDGFFLVREEETI